MSARPRLVEVGEPIAYAKGDNSFDHGDVVEDHEMMTQHRHHEDSNNAKQKNSVASNSITASTALKNASSLQKAAAKVSHSKRPLISSRRNSVKTETTFVIGENEMTDSTASSVLGDSHRPTLTALTSSAMAHHTIPSTAINDQHGHYLHDQMYRPQHHRDQRLSQPQHAYAHQHRNNQPPHQQPDGYYTIGRSHMEEDDIMLEESHGRYHHHHHLQVQHPGPLHQPHQPYDATLRGATATAYPNPNPIVQSTPSIQPASTSTPVSYSKTTRTQTSFEVGIDNRPIVRMEGVEDLGIKMPLVVLDGANVAHHYAQAMVGLRNNHPDTFSSLQSYSGSKNNNNKPEPDVQGIQVATDYFLHAELRVLVVLPQYWFRSKPRPGDNAYSNDNAKMDTPQMEILHDLKSKGLIVASPPTDDDDAYALTIARREETRSITKRNGEGPGFVLSNDLFRDAQQRDTTGALKEWLTKGRHHSDIGPGRISYTFGDMGTMNNHGEHILDFIPNPRHPLVIWMENLHHTS